MSELGDKQAAFEAKHLALGWFTNTYTEEPGEVSPPHRHGPAHLLILDGSVEFILDGTHRTILNEGDEINVGDGQLHEAIAGPEGFRYAFACPTYEAVRQGLIEQ